MIKNYLIKFYTPEGNSLIKNIQAASILEAKSAIMLEGYMPGIIIPNIFLNILHPVRNGGLNNNELSIFFMEFCQLTKSSGSVNKALSYMKKEHKKPILGSKFKLLYLAKWLHYNHKLSKSRNRFKLINNCILLLDKGETLKEIFISNNFEEIVLSLIDLADSTGDYPQAFLKISEYFDMKSTYKKSIIGTLSYPLFLFFLLFVAFSIFLYYIIPTFTLFFSQFPHIPQSTKDVIKLFSYLKNIFVYCVIFAVFIFTAFSVDLFHIKTKFMTFILDIPQIRSIVNYGYLNWIFYQFSIMISSGMTVNSVFNYFSKNTSKIYFKDKFELIYKDLMNGITLRDAIINANFLPEDAVESIGYAEVGGFLPETVLRLSGEFKEKSNHYMGLFTKGLFFLAITLVVFFLLLMFFSLFLPIIQGMVGLSVSY